MSEYQYYEFQTIDRSLTPKQMSELRVLSTRAVITANRFSNTYHYGDFRGNPRKLMESYFDAHVYVSNFGTVLFMLRLPRTVLSVDTLTGYTNTSNDGLDEWSTDEHTILEWRRDGEPADEWVEGENWISQLLPIRDELVRGDYRSLYIGWLSSLTKESGEEEDDVSGISDREPFVPAGLGSLTGSQVALAAFLGVNNDLIAVAAATSPEVSADVASDQKVAEWVAQLPEQEVRAIIARIIQGEGLRIQTELQSRYYRSSNESTENSQAGNGGKHGVFPSEFSPEVKTLSRQGRTGDELMALAAQTAHDRKRQEFEEQERKRQAYLAELVPRFSSLWATVNALAKEQKSSSYDKACTLLVDMRDAYVQAGRRPDFDADFARFVEEYSRRPALFRRLKEVRLLP